MEWFRKMSCLSRSEAVWEGGRSRGSVWEHGMVTEGRRMQEVWQLKATKDVIVSLSDPHIGVTATHLPLKPHLYPLSFSKEMMVTNFAINLTLHPQKPCLLILPSTSSPTFFLMSWSSSLPQKALVTNFAITSNLPFHVIILNTKTWNCIMVLVLNFYVKINKITFASCRHLQEWMGLVPIR